MIALDEAKLVAKGYYQTYDVELLLRPLAKLAYIFLTSPEVGKLEL